MTGYEQLERQLREVVRHRADPELLIFSRRGLAVLERGLRALPLVLAACLSAVVLVVATGTLRPRSSVARHAGVASSRVLQIGAGSTPLTLPRCPVGVSASACDIVLVKTTALESKTPQAMNSTIVRVRGFITAFSVGVSWMSSHEASRARDIRYLDQAYGGSPQAALSVLAPSGPAARQRWVVVAQSASYQLQSKLGRVVSFRLAERLPVAPGDAIALTVPTWAPVLSIGPDASGYRYRQSRSENCQSAPQSGAGALVVGDVAAFRCSYPQVRVEYSATELTRARQRVASGSGARHMSSSAR